MKYLNSLVFLGLMVLVAGCQKKEKSEPKKAAHHTSAKVAKEKKAAKKGPTKLETKKSAAQKNASKKVAPKKAADKKKKSEAKIQAYGNE